MFCIKCGEELKTHPDGHLVCARGLEYSADFSDWLREHCRPPFRGRARHWAVPCRWGLGGVPGARGVWQMPCASRAVSISGRCGES